ncbi:MAG: alkaline phosphatase family protein [Bacteroidales bacterium]|nr:alkaline phosphatase family protein [Bacteroidales bacterium]
MNRFFLVLFLLLVLGVHLFSQTESVPKKPKLIVNVVVEQMRYELLQRYMNKFTEEGFKKLINGGTVCENAMYDYLITESAPGYATIATGTTPSNHGIVSNIWYNRLKERKIYCVEDNSLANSLPRFDNHKYSPHYLFGSTFSDELKIATYKQSKVIGVALKDFAAILPSGSLADAVYWFDDETAYWTSSKFYTDSLKEWVNRFNEKQIIDVYLSREWKTLLPINLYKESLADRNSYEYGFGENKTVFPYDLKELSKEYGRAIIKYTPYGNTYTKDFAIAAIVNEQLGKDDYTDVINIGFSTTAYVNELFGLRSVELEDVYLRLDADLAHLIHFLEDFVGKGDFLIVLTSDRGCADNQNYYKELGMPVGKFNSDRSISVLESYLKAVYGRKNWVKAYYNRQVYLNQLRIDIDKISLAEIQMKTALFLTQFTGVANASTSSVLQSTDFTDGILRKFQNSYHPKRSGDVLINLLPGWIETGNGYEVAYYKQSSPYRYDAHVPLIWYGWDIPAQKIVRQVYMRDVAVSLSRLMDIAYPSGATGVAINELLGK